MAEKEADALIRLLQVRNSALYVALKGAIEAMEAEQKRMPSLTLTADEVRKRASLIETLRRILYN